MIRSDQHNDHSQASNSLFSSVLTQTFIVVVAGRVVSVAAVSLSSVNLGHTSIQQGRRFPLLDIKRKDEGQDRGVRRKTNGSQKE